MGFVYCIACGEALFLFALNHVEDARWEVFHSLAVNYNPDLKDSSWMRRGRCGDFVFWNHSGGDCNYTEELQKALE